jgi:hypothetical protein
MVSKRCLLRGTHAPHAERHRSIAIEMKKGWRLRRCCSSVEFLQVRISQTMVAATGDEKGLIKDHAISKTGFGPAHPWRAVEHCNSSSPRGPVVISTSCLYHWTSRATCPVISQHPQRGGTEGGNAQQHGTRAAAKESASSCAPDQKRTLFRPQAPHHLRQKLQPTKHTRQEPSTQQHTQSRSSRSGRGRDLAARVRNDYRRRLQKRNQRASPDVHPRQQERQRAGDPRCQAKDH